MRNISLRCPQNVSVKFHLKIPNRLFIISFWKWPFWVEAETHCFVHVSVNANELIPRPLFQIGAVPLQLVPQILTKKHLFGFNYHVYRTDIMRFKPY